MRNHKRENKALSALVKCAIILATGITVIILIVLFSWHDTKKSQTVKQNRAIPLVITTPEPATEGSVTIYTPDGGVYGYFGEINIKNDGKNNSQIDIELKGWLVGEYHHGEPEYTERREGVGNE